MAFWLYVDGDGSWSYGRKFYRGGPFEVPESTYIAAVELGRSDVWPFIADEKPSIPTRKPLSGTLTVTDLRHGTENTESRQSYERDLAEAARAKAIELFKIPETPGVKSERIACPVDACEKDYASAEPLERHLANKHPEFVLERELEGVAA